MNCCANCQALEEENRQLRRELGFELDNGRRETLRVQLGLTAQEGSVVLVLYQAKGRTISTSAIGDVIPHPTGKEDYSLTFVNVLVCKIRRKLGFSFIENVWGAGYRLSDSARAVCDTHIADAQRRAA